MKTNYKLQYLRVHRKGFLASIKRRLNTVLLVLTSKGFIFIKFENKEDRELSLTLQIMKLMFKPQLML